MSDSDDDSAVPKAAEEITDRSPDKGVLAGHENDDKAEDLAHDQNDRGGVRKGNEGDGVLRDIIMWRRRKISAVLMVVATALWLMLEVYRFNFLPLASYTAIGFITLLFIYGCIIALLRKEVGDMKGWEISEERAKRMADTVKRMTEQGIRWMFHVSCEREWYFFAGVVSGLFLLGYLGCRFNLLTLLYAGVVVGMTVPVICAKKEEQIKAYGERAKVQARSAYANFVDKVFAKLKGKKGDKKGKKVE